MTEIGTVSIMDYTEKVIAFMEEHVSELDKQVKAEYSRNGFSRKYIELFRKRGYTYKEFLMLFAPIHEDRFHHHPVYEYFQIETNEHLFLHTTMFDKSQDSYLASLHVSGVTKELSFFFGKRLPYHIKFKDRQAHVAMVAPPGSGKSVLMLHDVYRTRKEYPNTSQIIIDPHGSFARSVYKFKLNNIPDKVCFFAPKYFGENTLPSFNVFDLNNLSLFEINNITDTIVSAVAEVQEMTETSGNIEKVLQKCVQFLLARESYSTLIDLQDLLNLKKSIREEAKEYDNYFADEFEGTDRSSRHAVLRRIGKIIPDELSKLLLTRESTIDLQRCMDTRGMITIFDLSALGPITRKALGKFIMANIRGNALKRNEDNHTQCFVWVDEAPEVSAGSMQVILDQCRKYGVGLFLASQYLHQYGSQSKSVELSTAIKICSGQYVKDVNNFIVVPDKYLRKKQQDNNEYIEHTRLDLDRYEYFVKAPYSDLRKFKSPSFLLDSGKWYLTPDEQEKVDTHQKERYYTQIEINIQDVIIEKEEKPKVWEKEGKKYYGKAVVDVPVKYA